MSEIFKKNENFSEKSKSCMNDETFHVPRRGRRIKVWQFFCMTWSRGSSLQGSGLSCVAWNHCFLSWGRGDRVSAVPFSRQTLHFTSRGWAEGGSPHLLNTLASATDGWAGWEMSKSCSSQEESSLTGS